MNFKITRRIVNTTLTPYTEEDELGFRPDYETLVVEASSFDVDGIGNLRLFQFGAVQPSHVFNNQHWVDITQVGN